MNIFASFWHKICEPLDGFLWHRDISHPIIRPLIRNEILASGLCILAGAACYAIFPHLFWFGTGLLCITWVFWNWTRFFTRVNIGEYSSAFLRSILWRFTGRLFFLAILLYFALAWFGASAAAILAGMIIGACLALASYAIKTAFPGRL